VPKYSIVVPLHNEQENVTDLYDRLKAVMETAGETFEIVLVDRAIIPSQCYAKLPPSIAA
jgi:glycosyltransferase involved in cell wall biosynthesis